MLSDGELRTGLIGVQQVLVAPFGCFELEGPWDDNLIVLGHDLIAIGGTALSTFLLCLSLGQHCLDGPAFGLFGDELFVRQRIVGREIVIVESKCFERELFLFKVETSVA